MIKTRPHKRPRLWSVLWMGGTAAVMALGIGFTFNQLRAVSVADMRAFQGEVRLGRQPMLVEMPKLSRLDSVLVTEGDVVKAGQTLAVLDKPTMETKLAQLERRMLVLQFSRECFLDNRTSQHVDRWAAGAQTEIRAQLRIAAEDCDVAFDRRKLAVTKAEDNIANLTERLLLLGKRVSLLQGGATEPATHEMVRSLVDTLLAKSAIEAEIATAVTNKETDELSLRQNAVSDARTKTSQIAALENEILHLQSLLQAPRIKAPRAGRILRLRPPVADGVLRQSVDFAQIGDVAAKEYRVFAWVSNTDVQGIAAGVPVQFSILGAAKQNQFFNGVLGPQIADTAEKRTGFVAVEVIPDEIARKDLQQLDRSLALSDHSMHAELIINVARRPLLTSMKDSTRRALQGFGFDL